LVALVALVAWVALSALLAGGDDVGEQVISG
jgi:hypothetical protein